jgi:hypothetical protein
MRRPFDRQAADAAMTERRLSALEAANAIQGMRELDAPLADRTEGLVWMAWGLVAAGISMTFAFAAASATAWQAWFAGLWIPWAILGITFSVMLWRSAGLVLERTIPRRQWLLHVGTFLLATVGLVAVVLALHLPVMPPTAVLTGLGALTMTFGLARLKRQRVAGLVMGLTGLAFLGAAVWQVTAFGHGTFLLGVQHAATMNAPLLGLGLFLVGAVQYLR